MSLVAPRNADPRGRARHPDEGYRPEIDGLRALAVVPVICFHAGSEWFRGGFVGVGVFFVISGYLIAGLIIRDRNAGKFSFADFYERRARRILPALLVVMASCVIPALLWMSPSQLKSFSQSLVAVPLFVSNVLFWRTSGYFDSPADEKPLLHTWSLGVEEQYYLFFPLLIALVWRFGRATLAGTMLFVIGISLVMSEYGWRYQPTANFYLGPTRFWEILLGSLLALVSSTYSVRQDISRWKREVFSILGLCLIASSVLLFDKTTPTPSFLTLIPVAGALLVLAFATHGTLAAKALSHRWMSGIGLISYSAYLWHQPLFAFARVYSIQSMTRFDYFALTGVAFGLAYVTWRFIERPFRDRNTVSRKKLIAWCLIGSGSFVSLGLVGHFGERYIKLTDSELSRTIESSPRRISCHTFGVSFLPPEKACIYFEGDPTWAVFGDSHGVELAYSLAERLASRGESVLHLTFSGCAPALLFESKVAGCSQWLAQSLAYLESSREIKNVLVAFRHSGYLFGHQLKEYPELPRDFLLIDGYGPETSRQIYWNSFREVLQRLQRSGKRVFVLVPIPDLVGTIETNIFWGRNPASPVAFYKARNSFILEKLSELKHDPDVILVDPAKPLCDEAFCRAIIGNQAMYFDDNHLSLSGSRRVIQELRDYLR